jgi:hypothetical protein
LELKPFNKHLDALEEFWDAELPRIGEENGVGWLNTRTTGTSNPSIRSNPTELSITRTNVLSDPFTHWMQDERISERRMPTRSDHDSEDPYGTMMFSDIKNLLINLEAVENRYALKRIWLSVLGLHIPGFFQHLLHAGNNDISPDKDFWSRTQLRRHTIFEMLFPSESVHHEAESHAGAIIGPEVAHETNSPPIKEWGYKVLDNLEGIDAKGSSRLWERRDIEGIDVPTVRTLFGRLKDPLDPDWDKLETAFEAAVDLKQWVI